MLCCRKFPLAEKFINKRGVSIKIFPSEIFSLMVPKIFLRKPFSVTQVSGIEKRYDNGVMSRSSVEYFCLAVPKNFVGEPFCAVFQKFCVSQNLWIGGGGGWEVSRFFCQKVCVSKFQNFS